MTYKYLCEVCEHNNNGWCRSKQINGLKKHNIQECGLYKGKDKYTNLYNAVDKMLYDISTQYEVGMDIEDFISGVREVISRTEQD